MKKFLYLCVSIITCLNAMAQIDLYDRNWDTVFYDDFSSYRTWDPQTWISSDGKWKALAGNWVTHGNSNEHQLYQYQNCIFNAADNTMRLVSEYDWDGDIPAHNYSLPSGYGGYPNPYGQNNSGVDSWYYFSGEIDVRDMPFLYGYFEIKCKLPIHLGSFPAFWLVGLSEAPNNSYYNEIDVFEYSNSIVDADHFNDNYYKQFTCGIYCDNDNYDIASHARKNPILPIGNSDLRNYHVFSCEWLPYSVKWFVDGQLINDYYVRDSIPHHPMNLRTDYAIDSWALLDHYPHNVPIWFGSDVMTIDYIKVSQLNTDCDAEEIFTNQSDLDNFDYAVKKDIKILPSSRSVKIRNTDHITLRATDYVQINNSFQVEYGGEFTVIIHECPCSN